MPFSRSNLVSKTAHLLIISQTAYVPLFVYLCEHIKITEAHGILEYSGQRTATSERWIEWIEWTTIPIISQIFSQ